MDWQIPYLTRDLPGVGGVIRAEVEDFVVDEVPAYDPCGAGEHIYVRVEKRELSTLALIKQMAQALGISNRDISSAGLKDARAIARQTLSIHSISTEGSVSTDQIQALELDQARVLWVKRHRNKLRRGHLKGNRFTLRIREVAPGADARAAAILDVLAARGVPNGYGPQRFGNQGNNQEIGRLLLHNDWEGLNAQGVHHLSYHLRKFMVSALQSALFNQVLAQRITRGGMDDALLGDVMKKTDTGGMFTVEDVPAERRRVKAWEISPTGPIYGYKMREAKADAAALEAHILADAGLTLQDFRSVKAKGSRRPLRYLPEDLTWHMENPSTLVVSFFAPKGAFATMLLRELMKSEAI